LTTLNTVAVTPIPRAIVRTATVTNEGFFPRTRTA
jgi:hypothetical protein